MALKCRSLAASKRVPNATQRQKILAKAPSTQDAPYRMAVTVVPPSSDVSWHAKVRAHDVNIPYRGQYSLTLWEDTQIVEVPNDHQARWRHATNRPHRVGCSECCDLWQRHDWPKLSRHVRRAGNR